jgi:hypothetical protein
MNDKREPWHPTPSSNAKSINAGTKQPSEVIRGAAQHAFSGGPILSNASAAAKPISSGARSAAAAAGTKKPIQVSTKGQNPSNTNSASSAVAAYARGRPPPELERQSINAGILFGPTLSPRRQIQTRSGVSPESPAQQAARMASKSRSPAGRKAYSPSPQDKASMPQDQSALLAGKLASLRSHHDSAISASLQSQKSISPAQSSSFNLKPIPYLPKKPLARIPQDKFAGRLAGAAASEAATKHAQLSAPPLSPRLETRQYFPFPPMDSLSPDRSTTGGSLEAASTKSTFISPTDSEQSSILDDTTKLAKDQRKSSPIPAGTPSRRSPRVMASSGGPQSTDYRTGLTERGLADAIVAGSLASSRAPSPTKISASHTGTRHTRSHSHPLPPLLPQNFFHHEKALDLHTKSGQAPLRSLKHTLRKRSDHQEDDEEENTKRGRKHFMRKHPHKHHEGARKRWRDKVTERERRRYEGVWAANRGLLTFWEDEPAFGESWKRGPESDLVVNVVVRDIWERSRLPKDVLEEIWDLVATSEDAQALHRDQFVVGLWLIDQRLKGRKLPLRVSTDVWNSVRHTQGVKISRKPYSK